MREFLTAIAENSVKVVLNDCANNLLPYYTTLYLICCMLKVYIIFPTVYIICTDFFKYAVCRDFLYFKSSLCKKKDQLTKNL